MDFDDTSRPRTLRLILGDQLDRASPVLEGLSPAQDILWMAEVREESTHVWSHRTRTALFLSAMRHFRDELRSEGYSVQYHALDREEGPFASLGEALAESLAELRPDAVRVVRPGDHRVRLQLQERCDEAGVPLEVLPDPHFLTSIADFAEYAEGRKQLRLEYFYRPLRRRFDILMRDDEPEGGQWNYDADNRGSFGRRGPPPVPAPRAFPPDDITREVIAAVERHFPDHPGSLRHFDWPVTRAQALEALEDFVEWRLPHFGKYQDAMWTNEPYLFHSRLSAALNLKLLHPREVIDRAVVAYRAGAASLEATEGFVRQILGWREYVRGIYWHFMPEYAERNFLRANAPLPDFYWTAETEMHCLRQALHQTLEYGYAHHIQRLMVTGLFSMLPAWTRARSTRGTSRSTSMRSSGWSCRTRSACRSTQTAESWRRSRTPPPATTSHA